MTDYEINMKAKVKPIKEVLAKYNITEDIVCYGDNIAKIKPVDKKRDSKLILVTSTNPTKYGEGKTTLSIGLCDAMNNSGFLSMLALREPSLGPVFGTKGGATGGGLCQIYPMDKINLHFTGDFHSITSANNLIAAIIDDHIFHGNKLNIKEIYFKRCLDINDRSLRKINIGGKEYGFDITAASEMMSTFCMASSFEDLSNRIDNIIVGINDQDDYVYVKDLDCTGAILTLLKDAFMPNAVATLNNSLALVHGGPFANISFGCNSVVATKTALSFADYVITEAGFGSDLGALKFLDIKCSNNDIYPDLIVINSTVRSLKHHGNGDLEKGISNLEFHIKNMQKFNDNVLVVINKFSDDAKEDIEYIQNYCSNLGISAIISNMYSKGVEDTDHLVEKVVKLANNKNTKSCNIYDTCDDIYTKIDKMCKVYGATSVEYSEKARKKIDKANLEFRNLRICISKTPMSITDNKDSLGYPKDFKMYVTDIKINKSSSFIVVLMGDILTLPGLSKNANYHNMNVIDDKIIGLI